MSDVIDSKRLVRYIKRHKIRPEVIAADSGLSFSTVRNFLAGKHRAAPSTLRLIAEAAGYEEGKDEE